MAKTWSSRGPSNWLWLNPNQFAQGCSMPNFTLLGLPCSPLSCGHLWPFMAKIWSKHGPSNWLWLNPNQIDQGCSMPKLTLLGVSFNPLSYKWPKYGLFMAKT